MSSQHTRSLVSPGSFCHSLRWAGLAVLLCSALASCSSDDDDCKFCSSSDECADERSCFRFSDGLNRCANNVGDSCASFGSVLLADEPVAEPAPGAQDEDAADWFDVADINGDGLRDVVVVNCTVADAAGLRVLLGEPDGGHGEWLLEWLRLPPGTPSLADVDLDGNIDLLISDGEGAPYVFPGDGQGLFSDPGAMDPHTMDPHTMAGR